MKVFRLVDSDGFFLEDVVLYDAIEEKTNLHIDSDIPAGFMKPKWDGAVWIDDKADEVIALKLSAQKRKKLTEIKEAKKQRQLLPVEIRGVMFNGGRDAGQKYDEALRLSQMMNLTTQTFATADGSMLVVDKDYASEVVIKVASTSYALWVKEQSYISQIQAAITIADIDAITWED